MSKLGDAFPPEVIERKIFVSGGAFWLPTPNYSSELVNHLWFILNMFPKKSDILVGGMVTSKVAKRKRFRKKEGQGFVVIDIPRGGHAAVDRASVIDCGRVTQWTKDDLREEIRNGNLRAEERLSKDTLQRIRHAITRAKTISAFHKRLIVGPQTNNSG